MESFFRYIGYIDLLEEEKQVKTAGYLIWKYQNGSHQIEIRIQEKSITDTQLEIRETEKNQILGKIMLDRGYGEYKEIFPEDNGGNIRINGGKLVNPEELMGIYTLLEDGRKLYGKIDLPIKERKEQTLQVYDTVREEKEETGTRNIRETGGKEKFEPEYEMKSAKEQEISIEKTEKKKIKQEAAPRIVEPIKENKWQQLCKQYRVITPFTNGMKFIMVKPSDFIILQQEYQRLVHNSFLLHGYYEYGHLILGKLEDNEEMPYYIGVPGIYYEEEKKAAKMFGFIGFEGKDGIIENGSYGYYMIEVKI
ncbi:MAG: hypothetical protein IKW28_08855 [Lachnospiraceae bacterium]|nr:hypothetical protein [Lachnospiraceae bacterium]